MKKLFDVYRRISGSSAGTFFLLMIMLFSAASAQSPQTVPVRVSNQTQMINGKEYYIHIVEQGQTVFSISRAYGLKYYDAVIKTDIHLLRVGDTVWLPMNDNSVAAVSANANAVINPETRTRYIKIEPGQTLYSLSRQYGVTVEQIIDANPELRNSQLKAGQMIKIPPKGTSQQNERLEPPTVDTVRADNDVTPTTTPPVTRTTHDAPAVLTQEPVDNNPQSRVTTGAPNDTASTMPNRKVVVNPYPFDEVSGTFPTTQPPYYNFTTLSTFNYQVRELNSKDKIFVTVMMPLNLDKIDAISTSKFDIEQRGKREYKVFEFVQFYEGLLIALEELKGKGYNVVLNVVDVSSDTEEAVVEAWEKYNIANSDFIIALLVKKPFSKVAELAKKHQVFVINPFSSRSDVVKDNPYVIKYMASTEGVVKGMLDIMSRKHKNGTLYIIHSNNKNTASEEYMFMTELQKQLSERNDIKYVFFDWAANGKLLTTLKGTSDNVILSIYNQNKDKNTVYVSTLLNRLSAISSNVPILMTTSNYMTEYQNIDFAQLQHLNYITTTLGYLDFNRASHKSFIETYKSKFKTEPNSLYAGVAHDIIFFFVSALSDNGAEFWRNPVNFSTPKELLFPFSLKQSSSTGGYENQAPDIYQLLNYKLIKIN